VPYIGWVNNIVNGDLRSIVIPIVAGLLFLYAGWMLVSGRIEATRRRRRQEHADRTRETEAANTAATLGNPPVVPSIDYPTAPVAPAPASAPVSEDHRFTSAP
jgi:hypothetical protein